MYMYVCTNMFSEEFKFVVIFNSLRKTDMNDMLFIITGQLRITDMALSY